ARRQSTATLIARRRPGRPIAATVATAERLLTEAGVEVTTHLLKRKRDVRRATRSAIENGCDLVVALGGDGTVLQVATALAGTKVPLAIVPTGTGNLLAGNLGIPDDLAEAIQTAIAGQARTIDVGQIRIGNKRRAFTVACGVGFDADVMERTDSEEKGRWGKLAYIGNALRESGNIGNVLHRITLDGVCTTTEAAQVLVANQGRIGPGLEARGVDATDGLLDVYVVRASGPLPAILAGWEALRRTELGESDSGRVVRAQARKVRIETEPRRRVEIDGSTIGWTPFKAWVLPLSLTVMVPPG
ncbi:MAG TPA: diacylglycerol kinase family protein, partial [Candidatus Deferrimicrobium sp.]|nr:diacylglycerol kinase family protein [Candidatus Deferrimicrobium sp.]